MPFEALSSIPCQFESGNSVTVTMLLPGVLPSEGEAKLYLSLGNSAVTNITATESGSEFTFTITASASAALAPGDYAWAIRFTYTAGEVVTIDQGGITVTPNPATSQTASFAQAQVTLIESLFATLNASAFESVSFNGQSFTRANRDGLQKQWALWKARVIAEQRLAARRRGQAVPSNYEPTFT